MFADPGEKLPPVITASYDSECDACDGAIFAGDEIRSDGFGGWECASHAEEERAEDAPHVHSFTWNPQANESQCVGCGEPDTAAAKAARTVVLNEGGQYLEEDPPVVVTAARMDARASAALGLPLDQHLHTDATGVEWAHPGVLEECSALECCAHPNGYGPNGCAGCGAFAPSDPWDDPTPPAGPKLNVSGQPDARYEWYGKQNRGYLVKLPDTGDFRRYKNGKPKGLTRVTTFVKAASDSNALTDWAKRNVLIGASKRPDVVARAHGLDHETGKGELMSLVGELETAAGAKVSADIGTQIHELTERLDGDPSFTFADVPAQYRAACMLYRAELVKAGLRPVPGLIERTTYIAEYGGVVGTLDRVYYHERSGQYVIGDVKTGKTLKYGMDEIESQEWAYAHGVNQHGVYDWNTDEWFHAFDGCECASHNSNEDCDGPREVTVSEEWGVVVHMPVQGDDAGKVMLVRADLQRGRRHADVCHTVRVQRSNKPKPEPWTADLLKPSERDWDASFANVRDTAHAGRLWEAARAAGITGLELNRLVGLAQKTLRELGV